MSPSLALDGAEDGLYFYRRLAKEAGALAARTAAASIWRSATIRARRSAGLLREAGFAQIQVIKDLPGHDRVVRGTWKSGA